MVGGRGEMGLGEGDVERLEGGSKFMRRGRSGRNGGKD